MISRKGSVLLIGFLLFCFPLHVTAADKPGLSPEVAAFIETDGMTVFGDPEIMAIQAEMAGYAQKEDLADGEREKATALIDHILSSIERISREYMSSKRVAKNPVHTVQDYKELPSCVDDGSCSAAEQPELSQSVQQEQPHLSQPERQATEEPVSFSEMLNSNQTGSLEEVRASLKL